MLHRSLSSLLKPLEAGCPVVVGLTGPGARQAAARLLQGRRLLERMRLGTLPEGEGCVWFDEGIGGASQAAIVASALEFTPAPWLVLVTGKALRGPHPESLQHVEVTEVGEAPEFAPTEVELPFALEHHLAATVVDRDQVGDVAGALAAWDALDRRDPDAAERLRWVRLVHLFAQGRYDEVASEAFRGGTVDRGRALLAVAAASLAQGRTARARGLCRLARSVADDETRGELERLLQHVSGAPVSLEALPSSPFRRAEWMHIRLSSERDLDVPFPHLPVAEALRRTALGQADASEERCFLSLGLVQHAAGVRGQRTALGALFHYLDNEPLRCIMRARRALAAGDVDAAHRAMEDYPSDTHLIEDRRSRFVALLQLAVCAARPDRAARLAAWRRARLAVDTMVGSRYLPMLVEHASRCEAHGAFVLLSTLLEQARPGIHAAARASLDALTPRPVFVGELELTERLATGGMGDVWQGRHSAHHTAVAVKLLRADLGLTAAQLEAFRREIDVVTRLEHPGIVTVLDFGVISEASERQSNGTVQEGQPYLVMELVAGGTLQGWLGQLSWEQVRAIGRSLLDALVYAHGKGVLHRDIKPLNVLVARVGEAEVSLRLADFGLSALERTRVGTPSYMAPELFEGRPPSVASDLYALGSLMWALLHGRPPLSGTARAVQARHRAGERVPFAPVVAVPDDLEAWLRGMLAAVPSDRPPSAWAAARSFLSVAGELLAPGAELAPVAPQEAETFTLSTLLDPVPDPGPGLPVREPESFPAWSEVRGRAVYQPRLPTERLVHRGDPPRFGQDEALQQLWGHLEQVVRTRQPVDVYLGEAGGGRRSVVSRLRDRARGVGLPIDEELAPGRLAIAICRAPPEHDGPHLRIWFERPPPAAHRVPLRSLTPSESLFLVRARVPASFRLAARVAWEGVGVAAFSLDLLESWRREPGFELCDDGLRLLRAPERLSGDVSEWVRGHLAQYDEEELRSLQLAALLAPGFGEGTWARACAVAGFAARPEVLEGSSRCWQGQVHLAPALKAQLLVDGRPPELEAAAASVIHEGPDAELRRRMHVAWRGEPGATEALHELLEHRVLRTSSPMPKGGADALLVSLDLALDGDRRLRDFVDLCWGFEEARRQEHWHGTERLATEVMARAEARGDPRTAGIAWRLRLLLRQHGYRAPLDLKRALAGLEAAGHDVAALGGVKVATLQVRQGLDPTAAAAMARRAAGSLGLLAPRVHVQLARLTGEVTPADLAPCLTEDQPVRVRAMHLTSRAYLELVGGDDEAAYRSVCASTELHPTSVGWLYRRAMEVVHGSVDLEALALLCMWILREGRPLLCRSALTVWLAASVEDLDDASWWDLATAVGARQVTGPLLRWVLEAQVGRAPPDRAVFLRRCLGR